MYTKEQLKLQLSEMGIKSDDTVLIHTSFKAVGAVEGGPDAFIDAFCEYLSDGLFIIPTHTWENVNKESPVFDYRTTPACIGLIPRTACQRADGIRSLHPTHSVWVHGKGSAEFVEGEEHARTPAPVGKLWWRLGEVEAKILLIGVDHSRNTYIHAVDEIAGLDDRLCDEVWNVSVVTRDGGIITHPYRSHGNTGSDNFNIFEKAFIAHGAQIDGTLGDAKVRVVDAALCRDILLRLYSKTHYNFCLGAERVPDELFL